MAKSVRKLFTKTERGFIWKQTVGKPTGVKVEIAGFEFDLVPLTTAQAQQILEIIDAIPELQNIDNGVVKVDPNRIMQLVAKEGKRVMELAKSVLHSAAVASDMIDRSTDGEGEACFDEWFSGLSLRPTTQALLPALLVANGLGTLLKNAEAPAAEVAPAATETTTA